MREADAGEAAAAAAAVPSGADLLPQTIPPRNCFRLVVLGSARVGKSALVARFLNNKFSESYTPTIENFYRKVYRIRGEIYQLDILDTSGFIPFPAMQRLSFITGDLFVLVYSVDSRESFDEVLRLRSQIVETKCHLSGGRGGGGGGGGGGGKKSHTPRPVPIVIAGNMSDKDMRTVNAEETNQLQGTLAGCAFVETSAKKNVNVDELFRELFRLAELPPEMAPDSHRRLLPGQLTAAPSNGAPPASGSSKTQRRFRGFADLSVRRRLSDACGAVAPNVRRPSLRTDLMILKKKTGGGGGGGGGGAKKTSGGATISDCRGASCVIQ